MIVAIKTGRILAINGGIPGISDARVWQHSGFLNELQEWEGGLADKGYQGCDSLLTPFKKTKNGRLTKEQEATNALIASVRITVERTIGRFKNFRCLSTKWRGALELHPIVFAVLAQSIELSLKTNPLVVNVHELLE